MKEITIFTPTYNRKHTLEKAYNSLLKQTNQNFIWLIIDDGSIDGTEELVYKWKYDNKIEIHYYRKENGGKHTAYNYALNILKTEYVLIALDSDDYLVDNSIEYLYEEIVKLNNEHVGIVCLCDTEAMDNKFIKRYKVNELQDNSLQYNLKHDKFNAGAVFLFKSEYVKNFLYPEIENEKFFTEAYTYYQMDRPMIWTDKKICIREFRDDGLTLNRKKIYINNPKSWYLYNKLRSELTCKLNRKIKFIIYTIAFGIMCKQEKIISKSNDKVLFLLLYPVGFLGYLTLIKSKGVNK